MTADIKARKRLNQLGFGWNVLFMAILGLTTVIVVFPVLLIVVISFSSPASIAERGFFIIPSECTLSGYAHLFKAGTQLWNSYAVSIGYAVCGTATSLSLMTMHAYVLAQRNFRARRFMTWMLFFSMLFSGGLVPGYILNVRYLGINDTFWIFLLPGLANAWSIIILRTFLKTAVPESLIESARIDGAGHFRIFIQITLPLMKAGMATIGLFGFVNRWNDWFLALLYNTKPSLVPLQTLLHRMQRDIEFLKQNAAIIGTPDGMAFLRTLPSDNLRMACTVIVIMPLLFAYPFFQRYFIRGMLVGSIKE